MANIRHIWGTLNLVDGLAAINSFINAATTVAARDAVGLNTGILALAIDEGGGVISTGYKFLIPLPDFAIKITKWEIASANGTSGSIVVDLWADLFANLPLTVADSITTGEKPTLSSAVTNSDPSLNSGNGWSLAASNWLAVNVDSCTSITSCVIKLTYERT